MERRRFIGTLFGAGVTGILPALGQAPPRAVGLTRGQLTGLLFNEVLPGFTVYGEDVQLEVVSLSGGMKSSVERHWKNARQVLVEAKIQVFDSADTAAAGFAQIVFSSSGLAHPKTPTGVVFGEHCAANTSGSVILFSVGRVVVNIVTLPGNRADAINLAEGLAFGLEYGLRRSPLKLGIKAAEERELFAPGIRQRIPVGPNGIALAPLAILKKMGATILPAPGNATITVSLRERSVELRPFDRQTTLTTRAVSSKPLTLKAPVILYKGQAVVPVEGIAEALGMKAQRIANGKTRAIRLSLQPGYGR